MTPGPGGSPDAAADASRESASVRLLASSCCASSSFPGLDIIARQTSIDMAPTPSGSNGFFTVFASYHRGDAPASVRRREPRSKRGTRRAPGTSASTTTRAGSGSTLDSCEESRDPLVDGLGRVTMRAVPRARDEQRLRAGDARRDRVELGRRSVLVVLALYQQHGAPHAGRERLDVPASETRIEPDVVPAVERAVDVVVMARELGAKVRRLVRPLRGFDAPHRE